MVCRIVLLTSAVIVASAHFGYFENQIPLKPLLGGVCSPTNYIVAYKEI